MVQAGEEASSTEATQKITYVMRDFREFCSQTAGEDTEDVLSQAALSWQGDTGMGERVSCPIAAKVQQAECHNGAPF